MDNDGEQVTCSLGLKSGMNIIPWGCRELFEMLLIAV